MAVKKKTKKKKKKNAPRLAKTGKAQQVNLYRRKLQQVATAAGALAAYQLIPEKDLNVILKLRFRSLAVVAAKGRSIPPAMLAALRKETAEYLSETFFEILPGGAKISLHDFYTAGLSLQFYLKLLKDEKYEAAAEVKKGFAAFMECVEVENVPALKLIYYGQAQGWYYSKIDSFFYWFSYIPFDKRDNLSVLYSSLEVSCHPSEVTHVQLDGNIRPVYRVGTAMFREGVVWAEIRPADLKISGALSGMPMKVFAQSHALARLRERLDCEQESFLHYHLYNAFNDLQTATTSAGQILVEYRLFGIKVGYLVVEIVDGMAIVRTFLFLTNNGTPEGDTLQSHIGLVTQEKKYLEIDKLSTFVLSDLRKDKRLKALFTEAGCGGLFELPELSAESDSVKKYAAAIARYIGLR